MVPHCTDEVGAKLRRLAIVNQRQQQLSYRRNQPVNGWRNWDLANRGDRRIWCDGRH